jgi:Glu-tRNA(Gln) amidotransferase subunit E-like FAD-binding protein
MGFSFLGKKRLKEQHVARVFVGTLNELAEKTFSTLSGFLNEVPELMESPKIKPNQIEWFLYIIFSTNLHNLRNYFESNQLNRMRILVIDEFIESLEGREHDLTLEQINNYEEYIVSLDNIIDDLPKSMATAIFNKYGINDCQLDHFRKINTPNPIIIKSIEEATKNYIWNWQDFLEKYKMVA